MDKKYLNVLEVPKVDLDSTDRLVVIDVSNNIKVLAKDSLKVDLSDYYTKEATNTLLDKKADKITVTELATKLKEDTDKLNKDITDLGNKVDSIPVITVDTEMNVNSTNPVQNKTITSAITHLSDSVDEKLSNKQPKGEYALKSDIPTKVSELSNDKNYQTAEDVNLVTKDLATKTEVNSKQDTLVSGTNIKTVNGNSLLGSGNIEIQGGTTIAVDSELSTTSENPVQNKVITNALNDKAVKSDIPTKVSQLTNDSDFQTASQVSNSISNATSGLATKLELDGKQDKGDYATTAQLNDKQDKLVSGTNIKTVNGESLLGEGNIEVKTTVDTELSTTSENPVQNKVITNKVTTIEQSITDLSDTIPSKVSELTNDAGYITNSALTDLATKEEVSAKQDTLVSGTNIKTINGNSILGEGNINIEGGSGESPIFGMSLSGTTITMTEGTIANFFNAIKEGKGNYKAYITTTVTNNDIDYTLTYFNIGQSLIYSGEYFVRFETVAPVEDRDSETAYFAAKQSLVIRVTNNSIQIPNRMFESDTIVISFDPSDITATYYYGSYSNLENYPKIIIGKYNEGNTLVDGVYATASYIGRGVAHFTWNDGKQYKLVFNTEKIDVYLSNGRYNLDKSLLSSSPKTLTEQEYNNIVKNVRYNEGVIGIIYSSYYYNLLNMTITTTNNYPDFTFKFIGASIEDGSNGSLVRLYMHIYNNGNKFIAYNRTAYN